jgi:hypothetical protein
MNHQFNNISAHRGIPVCGCRLWRSSTQGIVNSTWTSIILDTIVADTENFFSSGNPAVATIPLPGFYNITGICNIAANGTGIRGGRILINGDTVRPWGYFLIPSAGAGANTPVTPVAQMVPLNGGDTVAFQVRQESGGTLNTTSELYFSPILTIVRIGSLEGAAIAR